MFVDCGFRGWNCFLDIVCFVGNCVFFENFNFCGLGDLGVISCLENSVCFFGNCVFIRVVGCFGGCDIDNNEICVDGFCFFV